MSRISIDVTPEEHQRLKALAALQGKTIKQYILERVFAPIRETNSIGYSQAVEELEAFIGLRIKEVARSETVTKSVDQIFEDMCLRQIRKKALHLT